MQYAILAGMLASIACGVMGTYVVVKRISLVSGGISHASLGGIGMALYFGIAPTAGALVFGLGAAVIIGFVSLHTREHEDTLIGALWAIGMAIGVIFIQLAERSAHSLEDFLFGSILDVTPAGLLGTAILDAVILAVVILLYKEFLAVSLDDEFARLRGVPVDFVYILLLCLVALAIVISIQIVGVIMVIALLSMPPAIARWLTHRLYVMMIAASLIGAAATLGGLLIAHYTGFAPGACIVLLTAAAYTAGLALRRTWTGSTG